MPTRRVGRAGGVLVLAELEGSQAVARVVARCRPQVVAAYPISPQTHIVEALSDLVRTGELDRCEYLMVESEFAALSACIGAAAAGSRTYTATASQGLLFMAEALPNAAGLALPVVMTVANRALGAPINIWNDHSDAMSQRDAGWVQLFAASNQEAVDLHLQAFRLAELLSVPVMVCMDGFVLTHAVEEIDVPEQEAVDAFLPVFTPRQRLDPADPITIGAMVGPEAFTEVRYLQTIRVQQALPVLEAVADELEPVLGRPAGRPVQTYRAGDAELLVVAMGSVVGTIQDVVDEVREAGIRAGVVSLTCFRPWPEEQVRRALAGVRTVLVVDRSVSPEGRSVLADDVARSCAPGCRVVPVVAGLGGRAVPHESLRHLVDDVLADRLQSGRTRFLDLDEQRVAGELARSGATR